MFRLITTKIVLFCIVIALLSCSQVSDEDPTLIVGEDFTNTSIRVLSIDTFSVELSTMKFDSIVTSDAERLLVGKYTDDFFGEVTTSSYFRLINLDYSLPEDAELDSVGLVLGYDSYFYNDTTIVSKINVHKLIDELESDDIEFYNTTEITYDSTPLVSIDYYPEPNRDSLYMTLPFNFGNEIFSDIIESEITNDEALFQKLEGITLRPGENDNSSIIGFTTNSEKTYLRFFYTTVGEFESEEQYYDLSISPFGFSYYNNIKNNPDGLEISNITDQEINLPSTETNNFGYLQAGVGYTTRIEFPSLKNIYNISSEGTILDATLRIKPNTLAYSDIQPISEVLAMYIVDQNNEILSQISNDGESLFAAFVEENSELNEAIYNIPINNYLDFKLNESPEADTALVLLPLDYNSTVNKILFNDFFNEDFEAELIITYAIYEQN